jgi:hypothetical protein
VEQARGGHAPSPNLVLHHHWGGQHQGTLVVKQCYQQNTSCKKQNLFIRGFYVFCPTSSAGKAEEEISVCTAAPLALSAGEEHLLGPKVLQIVLVTALSGNVRIKLIESITKSN